jgi:hypothetical protein
VACPKLRASCQTAAALKGGSFGKHATHDIATRRVKSTSVISVRLAIRIAQLFCCEQPFSGLVSRMSGIVECRAQRTIADLADPAGVIDLAGLEPIPLETNFGGTRFAATARAMLVPANLKRRFALVP